MPIHSAAMLYVLQVRRASGVGARSGFHNGLAERFSSVVTSSAVYGDCPAVAADAGGRAAEVLTPSPPLRRLLDATARADRATGASLAAQRPIPRVPRSSGPA